MPIVFAGAASHAPGITAWTEAAPKEQAEAFLAGYRDLGARLAAAKADTIVALTVEHWANFFSIRCRRSASGGRRTTTGRSKNGCAFPKRASPAMHRWGLH